MKFSPFHEGRRVIAELVGTTSTPGVILPTRTLVNTLITIDTREFPSVADGLR
jgi:hypothetical protein